MKPRTVKKLTGPSNRKKLTEEQAEALFKAALSWKRTGGHDGPAAVRLLQLLERLDRKTMRVLCTGDVPKVGEDIYVDTKLHLSHGVDDFEGGLCEVTKVTWNEAQEAHFIEIAEDPGGSTRWEGHLKERQAELEKEFGKRRGYPCPDNHPDANRWD